ncbi:uncharacterized protein LOC144649955 isoform X1 [Oculina patagonica]
MACVSESQQSQGTNGRSQITEEKLTKFLKNLPVEKSPSELKELQKTCDIKRPSKQWKDIVAVEFVHGGKAKDAVASSFIKKYSDIKGPEGGKGMSDKSAETKNSVAQREHQKATKRYTTRQDTKREGQTISGTKLQKATKRYTTRQDTKREGPTISGTKVHTLFNQVLQKRSQNKLEGNITQEEQQALKFIKEIEVKFNCKIIWQGENVISGFARSGQRLHYWTGRSDAVGLMNKTDKDNSRVIVIDWRTCGDVTDFWRYAGQYKEKLHQCIIYRKLLATQMREHFKDQEIPEPGIMIVAIDTSNIHVNDPRLCLDFKNLEEVGIFRTMDQFDWKPKKTVKVNEPREPITIPSLSQWEEEVKNMKDSEVRSLLPTALLLCDILKENHHRPAIADDEKDRMVNSLSGIQSKRIATLLEECFSRLTLLSSETGDQLIQDRLGASSRNEEQPAVKTAKMKSSFMDGITAAAKQAPDGETLLEIMRKDFIVISMVPDGDCAYQLMCIWQKIHQLRLTGSQIRVELIEEKVSSQQILEMRREIAKVQEDEFRKDNEIMQTLIIQSLEDWSTKPEGNNGRNAEVQNALQSRPAGTEDSEWLRSERALNLHSSLIQRKHEVYAESAEIEAFSLTVQAPLAICLPGVCGRFPRSAGANIEKDKEPLVGILDGNHYYLAVPKTWIEDEQGQCKEETVNQFEQTPTKSNDCQEYDKPKHSAVRKLSLTSHDVSQRSE